MKKVVIALPLCALLAVATLSRVGTAQEDAIQYLNNPGRADNNPYSNLVVAGDTVYLAGAIGVDPETGNAPDDVEQEIRIVLDSMKDRLERVGLTMDDLVDVRVYCTDLSLYDTFNDIYRTYFTDHFPARAFVGSGPLLRNGHFELTGIAKRR